MNPATVNRKKWSISNDFENVLPLPYANEWAGGAQIINSDLFFQNHIFLYKSGHLHTAKGLPIQPDVINPFVLADEEEEENQRTIPTISPNGPPPKPKS